MTDSAKHYDVTLTVDAEGQSVADELLRAFRDSGPFLAGPSATIASEGDHMTVRFADVSDDPSEGPTSVAHATPGAEIVSALAGFSHQNSLTVAVVKALLTLTAMREKAGLPPRRELRIDVVPATPRSQDVLSQRRSEGASG